MIPKTIHQVWIGDQSKRPTELLNSIKEMNPSWEYKLWTEDNLPELQLQHLIDAVPHNDNSAKCDLIRYELLYKYGGFYVDADSIAVKPFPDWLLDNDSFACWDNEFILPGYIANGYMGATKENALMKTLMDVFLEEGVEYIERMERGAAANHVGPWILTDLVLHRMKYRPLTIYPSHYFIPTHASGVNSSYKNHTFTDHLGGSTAAAPFTY